MSDSPTALLLDVANLIEHEGHWRGGPLREGYCVITGIQKLGDREHGPKAAHIFYEWLERHSELSLPDWNDAHSGVHVVASLRRAVREAERDARIAPVEHSGSTNAREVTS